MPSPYAPRKITIEHVSHHFAIEGRPVPVLDDVSLDVAAGEFLAIVGPSGCGKSTLLTMVSGLIKTAPAYEDVVDVRYAPTAFP